MAILIAKELQLKNFCEINYLAILKFLYNHINVHICRKLNSFLAKVFVEILPLYVVLSYK